MPNIAPQVVEEVHSILGGFVQEGDTVIDATCGLGRDTLYLAQCVGERGQVYAFDIQETACRQTQSALQVAQMEKQVHIICENHVNIKKYVQTPIRAAVFNLGYLPNGNRHIVTKAENTILAIQCCMDLLLPEGIIILAVYTGHEGGKEEAAQIEQFLHQMPARSWQAIKKQIINRKNAPELYLLQKK